MERRHPLVINIDEVPPSDGMAKGLFGAKVRRMGMAAGGKQLGCSLFEVAPGKAAFPFHWHLSNEEAIIVLAGTGTLRLGDATIAVRAGDYVTLPAGTTHAHQLKNTGTETLRYYCISTKKDPEVAGYPDSKKIGILSMEHALLDGRPMRLLFHDEETRDYFDGEPDAKGDS